MRVAAYQFAVSPRISENMEAIEAAVLEAKTRGIELLVFPECALTGYPPRDMAASSEVDFALAGACCDGLEGLCRETGVAFILGTIAKEDGQIFDRALFFTPDASPVVYDKRALWGWDRDNFVPGRRNGVFEYRGFRIGIRICYEVRFPEYFRELYRAKTDLDAVLFYDVSDTDDAERYDLIRGHLRTRAVENVCTIVSADSIRPYQTAPSAVIGSSGQILAECRRNREGFAVYDMEKQDDSFGERGRRELSDALTVAETV